MKTHQINLSPIIIIASILVIAAILSAGCTSSAPSSVSITPQVTGTVTTTVSPVITTTRQPSTTHTAETTTNPSAVQVFGAFTWAEYRNNMTTTPPAGGRFQWESDVRIECSRGTYNGTPAAHNKITTTSDYPEWVKGNLIDTKNGLISVTDRYFDASTNTFLGGTFAETIKGVAQPVVTFPADSQISREDRPWGEMGITPFGNMDITLTDTGTKSVTVPTGTYPDARTYTGKFRDGTPITFWVVSGIPVPVQYQFPNKYLVGENPFQSYELKGWG